MDMIERAMISNAPLCRSERQIEIKREKEREEGKREGERERKRKRTEEK